MAQSKYGRFQPWELSTWVPNILPKTRIFCGFEFPEICGQKGQKRAKMHKKLQKTPFFPHFYKSVDLAQTPPSSAVWKKSALSIYFFFNASVIGFNYGITSKRVKFHTFSVGSICLNEFTLLFYDFLTCGLLKHFWT